MARRITVILLVGLFFCSAALVLGVAYQTYSAIMHDFDEQGTQNALIGAQTTKYVIEKAIANGIFDVQTMFDDKYESIEGSVPPKYHSGYDHYFDRNVKTLQDNFLAADSIYYAYAITEDGYVPVHSDPNLSKRKFNIAYGHAADGTNRWSAVCKDNDGYEYYEYSSPIIVYGRKWGEFRVGIPVALVERKLRAQIAFSGGLAALCSLVLAVIIYFVVRRSLKPLADISAITARMAAGDFEARSDYRRKDELGILARSFNYMADNIAAHHESLEKQVAERTASLRAEKEFTDNIIETANSMIVAMDPQGSITKFNRFSEEITGYSRNDVMGKDGVRLFIEQNDTTRIFEVLQKTMIEGNTADIETILLCKNGEKKIITWNSSALKNENGEIIGTISLGNDITERKRAEEEAMQAREEAIAASEELACKVEELERFNRLSIGREMRLIELKEQINDVYAELGKEPPYNIKFAEKVSDPKA